MMDDGSVNAPNPDDHQFMGSFSDEEKAQITEALHDLDGDQGPISPPYWSIFQIGYGTREGLLAIDNRDQQAYSAKTLEELIEALWDELG